MLCSQTWSVYPTARSHSFQTSYWDNAKMQKKKKNESDESPHINQIKKMYVKQEKCEILSSLPQFMPSAPPSWQLLREKLVLPPPPRPPKIRPCPSFSGMCCVSVRLMNICYEPISGMISRTFLSQSLTSHWTHRTRYQAAKSQHQKHRNWVPTLTTRQLLHRWSDSSSQLQLINLFPKARAQFPRIKLLERRLHIGHLTQRQ